MSKVVVFSANRGYALLSSRRELIEAFLTQGWRVVLATADDPESRELAKLGAVLEPVVFNRGSLSLIADFRAYCALRNIVKKYNPTLGHFFHAKPVLMGTLAVKGTSFGSSVVVNTITGLGQAFVKGGFVRWLASIGYRKALRKADATIFQNRDDKELFCSKRWLSDSQARLVAGSGVPLERFVFTDRASKNLQSPVIVMLARLLKQKGIPEFVEVASRVRKAIPNARFVLAGEEDASNPDRVDVSGLKSHKDIEYVGRLQDVVPLLVEADLFVFPSYYREGVPRVVMEAAATGLPTVAFDVPGVREAVRDGRTGYLVPDRDVEQMTERVLTLLQDRSLRLEMGKNASELAKESFDIRAVQKAYLDIYREFGIDI